MISMGRTFEMSPKFNSFENSLFRKKNENYFTKSHNKHAGLAVLKVYFMSNL